MATKKAVLFSLLYLLCLGCFAQLNYDYTEGKFFIKGMVIDVESKKPVPLANIHIQNTNKGYSCDNEGRFTFYVSKRDTLKFTSTGYISKLIIIKDLDSTKYYTLEIQLMKDFIQLKGPTIYPYHDLLEFKKAFVEGKGISRVTIAGVAPAKYSNKIPSAKLSNPISFIYEKMKHRRSANPDFKP